MPSILEFALCALAVPAGLWDLRLRRIPNWLCVSGLLLGILLNAFLYGFSGLSSAGFGILLALVVYFPLYAMGGMAAGDVKLMAAVGAIVGPANWMFVFLATALLGGVAALIVIVSGKRTLQTFRNASVILANLSRLQRPDHGNSELNLNCPHALKMPHGAAIAAGCVCFLAWIRYSPQI